MALGARVETPGSGKIRGRHWLPLLLMSPRLRERPGHSLACDDDGRPGPGAPAPLLVARALPPAARARRARVFSRGVAIVRPAFEHVGADVEGLAQTRRPPTLVAPNHERVE